MANQLPFIFRAAPLPTNFRGTPQQLLDAMVARLSAESETEIAVFVTGSVEPSSNVGPWLKDGVSWYVWDDVTGSYVPQTIPSSSLGYIIGSDTPDNTLYRFWIQTQVNGSPMALKIYYSGSWVDVYASQLSAYMTTAAFNAAIASYYTAAQTNAAIAAAIAGIPSPSAFPAYPAQAEQSVSPQAIPIDAAPHKCTLGSAPVNPSPSPFNTGASRYIAPANGYYWVACRANFTNGTGTASGMAVRLHLYLNGSDTGVYGDDNTPSPNGGWYTNYAVLIQMNQNDYVEAWATIQDGVNSGSINLSDIDFSITRSQAA